MVVQGSLWLSFILMTPAQSAAEQVTTQACQSLESERKWSDAVGCWRALHDAHGQPFHLLYAAQRAADIGLIGVARDLTRQAAEQLESTPFVDEEYEVYRQAAREMLGRLADTATGNIDAQCTRKGARISIGGVPAGTCGDLLGPLAPGLYSVLIDRGSPRWTGTIRVTEGQTVALTDPPALARPNVEERVREWTLALLGLSAACIAAGLLTVGYSDDPDVRELGVSMAVLGGALTFAAVRFWVVDDDEQWAVGLGIDGLWVAW